MVWDKTEFLETLKTRDGLFYIYIKGSMIRKEKKSRGESESRTISRGDRWGVVGEIKEVL